MAEPPPNKKLRYAEADLKVVIGSEVPSTKDDPLVEYHHSVVMARHSTFVDNWLEKESTKDELKTPRLDICFPDIPPKTWKKMISLIENAVASRDCSIQDALECLPFYHKYDFTNGCELCEHILKDYLQPLTNGATDSIKCSQFEFLDVDTFVDVAVLAHKLNLRPIMPLAEVLLKRVFNSLHSVKLTEHDIEKLLPLILDTPHWRWSWTKDEVLSPLFPKYAVQFFSNRYSTGLLNFAVTHIQLTGSLCGVDGLFKRRAVEFGTIWERCGVILLDDYQLKVEIGKMTCWEIYWEKLTDQDDDREEDDDKYVVLWECPKSENAPLPPPDGWKAVSKLVSGTPKLDYNFVDSLRAKR